MKEKDIQSFRVALLGWYDAHARAMPWRVGPAARQAGQRPDPYRVWLSEIMLQQTVVAAATGHFNRFVALWPDVSALAQARDEDVMAQWAGLGYYARARNLLACARQVAAAGGAFPRDEAGLLALPGIGPYTAASVSAIAFDAPSNVVDGNVERVMARLFNVQTPLPAAKPALKAHAAALVRPERPGDYAQGLMDLGATICTPKSPKCLLCPVMSHCQASANGGEAELPRRTPKTPKPTRYGIAYVARRDDGALLLETRPEKGLLGGMKGFVGTDWREEPPQPAPPLAAQWMLAPEIVKHTFTHFHLRLEVMTAQVPQTASPARGAFSPASAFSDRQLPTVMRKVFRAGFAQLERSAAHRE